MKAIIDKAIETSRGHFLIEKYCITCKKVRMHTLYKNYKIIPRNMQIVSPELYSTLDNNFRFVCGTCLKDEILAETISLLGIQLTLKEEVYCEDESRDIDLAHESVQFYKNRGKTACAIHKYNKHQIYSN